MSSILLALKLGLFAPAGYGKMPLSYLATDLISPRQNMPGIELGYGLDLMRRGNPMVVNGSAGMRTVYVGAGFAGLTFPIKRSLSAGAGVKYRMADEDLGVYVGLAVRFKAVEWKTPAFP